MSDTEKLAKRIDALEDDEKAIVEVLLDRLEKGRKTYGPWKVDDGRDLKKEAFEEVIDALHYCAARLVQLSRCPCCKGEHPEKVCA